MEKGLAVSRRRDLMVAWTTNECERRADYFRRVI